MGEDGASGPETAAPQGQAPQRGTLGVTSLRIQGLRTRPEYGHPDDSAVLRSRITSLEDALTGLVLELEAAGALPPLEDKGASDVG